MDAAIAAHIQRKYRVYVGTQTAELLKVAIGSALPLPEETVAEIRGRDQVTGLPKTVVVPSEEIREVISDPINTIVEAVKETLRRTPPELASDVMDRGMVLSGGGALLEGLDERLRQETGVPVYVAEEPLACVAIGSGRFLEEIDLYGGTLSSE
jgi:rod shape-determining protein MreB and related proteins